MPGRVTTAHLERGLSGKLEHLMMEKEEPREPELVDQLQLVFETCARLAK